MRTFFGHVVCECESVMLVCYAVTTPDATMEITGHQIFCMECVATFHNDVDDTLRPTDPAASAIKRVRGTSSKRKPGMKPVKSKG